jgi:hypothetical protein
MSSDAALRRAVMSPCDEFVRRAGEAEIVRDGDKLVDAGFAPAERKDAELVGESRAHRGNQRSGPKYRSLRSVRQAIVLEPWFAFGRYELVEELARDVQPHRLDDLRSDQTKSDPEGLMHDFTEQNARQQVREVHRVEAAAIWDVAVSVSQPPLVQLPDHPGSDLGMARV